MERRSDGIYREVKDTHNRMNDVVAIPAEVSPPNTQGSARQPGPTLHFTKLMKADISVICEAPASLPATLVELPLAKRERWRGCCS